MCKCSSFILVIGIIWSYYNQFTIANPATNDTIPEFSSDQGKTTKLAHLRDYSTFGMAKSILEEYTKLHSTLINSDGNPMDVNNSTVNYLVWRGSNGSGVGNRIISLAASLVLAILTNRVLITQEQSGSMLPLFEEPFYNSSWLAPPRMDLGHISEVAGAHRLAEYPFDGSNLLAARLELSHLSHDDDFSTILCKDPIVDWKSIKYIFIDTCQYFLPLLFANPKTRQFLEKAFPDRQIFTPIVRFLFRPIQPIMEKVIKVQENNQKDTHDGAVIGLQLRSPFNDSESAQESNDQLAQRCLEAYFPHVVSDSNTPKPCLYVAALQASHQDWFHTHDSSVVLHALPPEGRQQFTTIHLEKAVEDIWVLASTSDLITSPVSTFGYVAAGLRGLSSFVLNPDASASNACIRQSGGEPCYHRSLKAMPENLCSSNPEFPFKPSDLWMSYMEDCADCASGMKIISSQ